jgi:hypothetical protein
MGWQQNAETAAASQKDEGSGALRASLASDPVAKLERNARIALGLYLFLGVLAWFTLDGTVLVYGRPVELRLVPLVVLGGMAFKTILAVKAEKIRRASRPDRGEEDSKS